MKRSNNMDIKQILRICIWFYFTASIYGCNYPRKALITIIPESKRQEQYQKKTNLRQTNNTYAENKKNEKLENFSMDKEVPEIPGNLFEISYKSITDNETSLIWQPYHDNPTSMFRYIMEEKPPGTKLPAFSELRGFFEKVRQVIAAQPNGELAGQLWLKMDGDYISSSEIITDKNKKGYKGIHWNYTTNNYETVTLGSGDLVNIILVSH